MLTEPIDHLPPYRGLSRRALLGAGAAAALGAPFVSGRAARAGVPAFVTQPGDAPVRNLIFMVADGMSAGVPALVDQFGRYTGAGMSALTKLSMQTHVRRSMCSTHSATAAVTDSAAASSAWSTGVKHPDGHLCMLGDGAAPMPLLMKAKELNKRVGCVTTTTITHATPAAWYANVPDRELEKEIGEQLLERQLDVAMGGGAKFFSEKPEEGRPHLRVLRTREELLAEETVPRTGAALQTLGLFNGGHIDLVLDRPETQPGLLDMAKFAVNRLASLSGNGFVLQIEGGRVDYAAHRNDAPSLLNEMREFDRTVAWVAEWVMARKDTLLVITTDHGTANPGLTLYGMEGIDALRRLADAKHSMYWVLGRVPEKANPSEAASVIVDGVKQATGVDLGERGASILRKCLRGEQPDPFMKRNLPECVIASLLADSLGVSFVSPNHTADHVQLLAMGAGAETLPGFQDNTQTHDWMAGLLRLGVETR